MPVDYRKAALRSYMSSSTGRKLPRYKPAPEPRLKKIKPAHFQPRRKVGDAPVRRSKVPYGPAEWH